MKHFVILFSFFGLFIFIGKAEAAEINGTITNGAGKKIYLEKFEMNRPVKIDSIIISKKNKFKFTVNDSVTEFYRLSFNVSDFIVLVVLKDEKVEITADVSSINKTYKVEGSPHSEKLADFVKTVNDFGKFRDSVNTVIMKDSQNQVLATQLNNELNTKYMAFVEYRNKFINENPESPSLVAVVNHLNLKGDARNEIVYLKKVEDALFASMPTSYYYKSIHEMVGGIEQQIMADERKKELEAKKASMYDPGNELSDITLNDVDGEELKLSSLRGSYVLVDFWASWCGPCRKENPNVVKLYNKYKEKGFTVYSVSLDNNKDRWIDAISKDKLEWKNHVSELKGWQTSILPEFGVNAIPFTVLIDKEGKVIQANLRGPALESKLSEIFGF